MPLGLRAEAATARCLKVQPDLAVCGGFTAWTQILDLANAYGVATIPHVWGSGIGLAGEAPQIDQVIRLPQQHGRVPAPKMVKARRVVLRALLSSRRGRQPDPT